MMVKCGNRKLHGSIPFYHTSAEAVRNCYAAERVIELNGWDQPTLGQQGFAKVDHATEKQVKFIVSLRTMKGLEPLSFAGTKSQASAEIDRLTKLPNVARHDRKVSDWQEAPEVADGHYAVEEGGTVKFFRVRNREYNSRRYVYMDQQAGDDFFPVANHARRQIFLDEIAGDPKAASLRYGRLIGRCGVCNRTLTDATSIARGIGPVCADKLGW